MNIKTLTAPSIQEALSDARQLLGDDVVLLESVAAQDGQLARITVMADANAAPARQPAALPAAPPVYATVGVTDAGPTAPETPAAVAPGYGYAAAPRAGYGATPEGPTSRGGAQFSTSPPAGRPVRRGAAPQRGGLFPDPAPAAPALDLDALEQRMQRLLDERLGGLYERLDGMERARGTVLQAVQEWAAHPLFSELVREGFRAETVGDLFQRAYSAGLRGDDPDELRWAVARALRQRLDHTTPTRTTTGSLVVLGPAGAGKTSLILKLATHPSFYGRLQTAVLVIAPEDTDGVAYHDPTDLYRRFGLAVMTARTQAEVDHALERTSGFDQLLIDTPPMPVQPREAQRMVARVQQLLQAVVPLDVHLVLDATRALDGFDADYPARLPLRPTSASLTRLDETFGWGRVAEWLLALDLPVRFASTAPGVPDGLQPYTPGWFVDELVQRTEGARRAQAEAAQRRSPQWT